LFHSESANTWRVYFVLFPYLDFIKERDDLRNSDDLVIFSCENVFKLLDIDFSYYSTGFLKDLYELSLLIEKNSTKILEAFSRENIKNTSDVLIKMEGNNVGEVNRILKTIKDLVD